MTCTIVKLPTGERAIVCGPRRKAKRCACGSTADRLCDWFIDSYHRCSEPVCSRCTTSPAPEKDLCKRHAAIWAKHPANPINAVPG